jgi:hypothetical protein
LQHECGVNKVKFCFVALVVSSTHKDRWIQTPAFSAGVFFRLMLCAWPAPAQERLDRPLRRG